MSQTLTCEYVARAVLGEPDKRRSSEVFWRAPWRNDEDPVFAGTLLFLISFGWRPRVC